MSSYRDRPTSTDRAKAIVAVTAIHVGLALLVLSSVQVAPEIARQARTQLIEIVLPPPPPPPTPPVEPRPQARLPEGEAGKKAVPAPVVAPPPRIVLPAKSPLPSAPVAGTGSATSAGSAKAGSGAGAGGQGTGQGGGGTGGSGIGEDARLLVGGLTRRDYRRLRAYEATSGAAVLALMVGADGRVAQCSVRQSSGNPALDVELCAIMQPRMIWAPARDRAGRALTVGIYYTATWSRY